MGVLTPIAALIVALTLTPSGPSGQARLRSVESRVDAGKLATKSPELVVRAELEDALSSIDWKREGVVAPFEILAVLADADSSQGREGARARCVVRIVLREPGGALLGSVSGKATAEDAKAGRASVERDVLDAAVGSASSAIPEAVRRARKAR